MFNIFIDSGRSIDVANHDRIEVFEADLSITVGIGLFKHGFDGIFIQIFLELPVDVPEILKMYVSLIVPIVFLEHLHYVLFALAHIRPRIHGVHELPERYTTRLLHVEFRDDLVHGSLACLKAILPEQQFEVIGQEHSHSGGVIEVENFFEVKHVLLREGGRAIIDRIELPEIFSLESDVVVVDRSLLAFARRVAHPRALHAARCGVLEGAGSDLLHGRGAHGLNNLN